MRQAGVLFLFGLILWGTFLSAAKPTEPYASIENIDAKRFLFQFACSDLIRLNLQAAAPDLKIYCDNKKAVEFLKAAQYFMHSPYVLDSEVPKESEVTTRGLSGSGLVVVALRRMASQGFVLEKAEEIEKQVIKENARVRNEPNPCSFIAKNAKPVTDKTRVPNLADTQFGCFWLTGAGKKIAQPKDLRTGDLVFFEYTYVPKDCSANDRPRKSLWSDVKNYGCFRGVQGKPITHVGIVQYYNAEKGILYTFEEARNTRLVPGTCRTANGAAPRIWCDPKKRNQRSDEQNILCDDNRLDLTYFGGGIRLYWK